MTERFCFRGDTTPGTPPTPNSSGPRSHTLSGSGLSGAWTCATAPSCIPSGLPAVLRSVTGRVPGAVRLASARFENLQLAGRGGMFRRYYNMDHAIAFGAGRGRGHPAPLRPRRDSGRGRRRVMKCALIIPMGARRSFRARPPARRSTTGSRSAFSTSPRSSSALAHEVRFNGAFLAQVSGDPAASS